MSGAQNDAGGDPETFDLESFEAATEIVARRLASFRLGLDAENPYEYNDDEKLKAGIIVGSILAQFSIAPLAH